MEVKNKYKLRRKLQKYKNICTNYGFTPLDRGTKSLMVCNAGLVNGFQREDIFRFFEQYGPIEDIVTCHQKSYSFVTYHSLIDAQQCYETVNGILKLPNMRGPLYLMFIESVPGIKNLSTFMSHPPSGLQLIEDFVNKEQEDMLLACVGIQENFKEKVIKHRRVKHYGYEFHYSTNTVDKNNPLSEGLPPDCDFLWEQLKEKGHEDLLHWKPNQLTVNHYLPGQGIPPHIDTHSCFGDPILSLSLGSDVVMDFKNNKKYCHSLLLPRRSLLIMSGESRYAWSHGITPRKTDVMMENQNLTVKERGIRTSFTFRYVQQGDCKCIYPEFCDSQTNIDPTIPENVAADIEANFVHKVYDNISEHFSNTRHTPWPNVLKFVKSFPKGSIIIDIGCGNGKYFGFNDGIFEVGCDISPNLALTCRNRGFETTLSNCLSLPFKSGIADAVISIAVIHHLASQNRRLEAIKAIVELLRNRGRALIYVWAKNQTQGNKRSSYLKCHKELDINGPSSSVKELEVTEVELSPTQKLKLPVHTNRTAFKHQDLLVPWKLSTKQCKENSLTFLRYYHVFEEKELEQLCKEVSGVELVSSYYEEGNWCVIIEKI